MCLLPLTKSVWEGVLSGCNSLHVANAQDDDPPDQEYLENRNARLPCTK